MTWEQWSVSIRSKVNSSRNLHDQMPSDLHFFILLSSISGIVGSLGQVNYAAGNTYQDALAAHRIAIGQKATSINLGWMADVGVISENEGIAKGKEAAADMAQIYESEFLALLDRYCDPSWTPEELGDVQPIVGLMSPADFYSKGIEPPSWLLDRPIFRYLARNAIDQEDAIHNDTHANFGDRELARRFSSAKSDEDAANIMIEAFTQKIARTLAVAVEDIDRLKPLHTYGVDSLLAVELRNWFAKVVRAEVAIFDITGQASLEKIADDAARKSELRQPQMAMAPNAA